MCIKMRRHDTIEVISLLGDVALSHAEWNAMARRLTELVSRATLACTA